MSNCTQLCEMGSPVLRALPLAQHNDRQARALMNTRSYSVLEGWHRKIKRYGKKHGRGDRRQKDNLGRGSPMTACAATTSTTKNGTIVTSIMENGASKTLGVGRGQSLAWLRIPAESWRQEDMGLLWSLVAVVSSVGSALSLLMSSTTAPNWATWTCLPAASPGRHPKIRV